MIFNSCGKSLSNYLFRYGAEKLKNVKSYKYLGLIMSPYNYGNFNLARKELKKAINTKRDGKQLQRKYKINDEVI